MNQTIRYPVHVHECKCEAQYLPLLISGSPKGLVHALVYPVQERVSFSLTILYRNSRSSCVCSSMMELGSVTDRRRDLVRQKWDLDFDESGPTRHETVTKLDVQGDRARPGKNGPEKTGIQMNKELEMKLFGNK